MRWLITFHIAVLWNASSLRFWGPCADSSSRSEDKPLGYIVNLVWPPGSSYDTKMDVIFFEGNVGGRKYLSCKDTWVQRGKPDVCWPRDWLPKDFKGDIRVLLLQYSISEAGVEGVVDELQRLLVFSECWNRGHTWKYPVVLVGHSLGCVVIEQLVVALDKRVKAMGSLEDEMEMTRATVSRAFLASLVGCFFYAPPWKGLVPSEDLLKHVFGGLSYSRDLFADLCLDSPKLAELSEEFMQARSENVKLMALIEGFHTRGRTVVPPASMQDFGGAVVNLTDSNHIDACKPINREHLAYRELVEFIGGVLNARNRTVVQLASVQDFPGLMVELPDSNHSGAFESISDEQRTNRDFVKRTINALNVEIELSSYEALTTSVSQMSLSNSRSINKDYRAYERIVGFVLNVRKVMSGSGHFYGNQCRVLKEQLSLAKEVLIKERASKGVSSGDVEWPKLALTELHRVVKLGKALIQSCYSDKVCLKAYLRLGERTQAFVDVLKEIVWCTLVVAFYHNSAEGNLSWNSSIAMDEFPQARLGDELKKLLQEAAKHDRAELEDSLASWILKHPCSARECGSPLSQHQADDPRMCLGAQILARGAQISARASNSEGGITRDEKDDHTAILWKTSQEVLEDGTRIGAGSSATVTETTWLGDKYAKKKFEMVPKHFEDEANALAKLNHPHIVKVSAYSVGSRTCFFLMDIMPFDLRTHMNNRVERLCINPPFTFSAAIDLMLQISEAMSYMNSKKMVHRDLKSFNILVTPMDDPELCKEGFVIAKVADFGLSKSKHEITSHSHLTRENLGTSKWRAPEMFKEAKPSEGKALPWQADVYSFGIVCYEILTGKFPYEDVEDLQMAELYSRLTDPHNPLRPELPENCPESVASLIRECWHTAALDRPTFEEISTRLRYLKGLFMMASTHH